MKQPLVIIAGPTASGKTAAAVELAVRVGGEIISADSMQIYRGLDIGTAKPTEEEKRGIPHHLLDVAEPEEPFSVADFAALARQAIGAAAARGALPILAGGTGLYLRAVADHLDFSQGEWNPAIRENLKRRAEEEGNEALHRELEKIDPASAARIHPNDQKRMIRALEVVQVTGMTMTEYQKQAAERPSPYRTLWVGLLWDREILYERINRRVDQMLSDEWIEEVRRMYPRMRQTARQSIGYKELEQYLQGECTLEEAAEEIKRATRRYAKRQMTFFRADKRIKWIDATKKTAAQVADEIERLPEFREMIQ